MSRYNIHIDPQLPEPDRVSSHQNFDALFQEYRAVKRFEFWRTLYRNPRVFAGVAAAIALMVLLYQAAVEEQLAPDRMGAPIAEALPPDQVWTLMGDRDTTLRLTETMSLWIPAGSLLDSAGQPFLGEYRMAYRGLDNASEQFVSGAVGVQQPFYLEAHTDATSLVAGPGLALRITGPAVPLAQYQDQQWLAMAETHPLEIPAAAAPATRPEKPGILSRSPEEQGIKELGSAPQLPGKPFGVKIKNQQQFPQFRGYANVYWEYIPKQGYANPWEEGLIDETWGDVAIRRYREDSYELLFTRPSANGGLETRKVVARPYLEAQTEPVAMAIYQDRMAEYSQALSSWERDKLEVQRFKTAKEKARADYEAALKAWEAGQQDTTPSVITGMSYPVARMGYWGFLEAVATQQDSSLISLHTDISFGTKAEPFVKVFAVNASNGLISAAVKEGGRWKIPMQQQPTMIWAYGLTRVWVGNYEGTESVTVRPMPDSVKTAEELVRYLEGLGR
ncbi:MAG: hypothetical protein NWR72_03315 [Bacteroidia bacterium]|nr:hypothetical protein [Bacteroidia bacterium]